MVLVIHSIPEEATVQITDMTPVQIDTELSAIWNREQTLRVAAHRERQVIATRPRYLTEKQIANHVEHLGTLETGIAAARAAAKPYEAEYASRPWNRYFLVTNSNGHVHRGMNCGTCFPTTEYAWVIDLADCDEATMVVEYGESACTVCFPEAPSHPAFHTPGRRNQAERDARAAEKAQRDEAKAAKAITAPDGSPLRGEYGVIRTKVAARNELSQAVQSHAWYGPTHPSGFAATAQRMAEALAAAGIDPLPIAERAATKAAKEGATYGAPHFLVTWEVAA